MSLIRREILEGAQRVLLAGLVIVALAVIALSMHLIWTWGQGGTPAPARVWAVVPTATLAEQGIPTAAPVGTPLPTRPAPADPVVATLALPSTPKVGIVAGHWENDSGAVCPDGLTEVEINLSVAQQVVSLLTRAGYQAEILAEFSPKLKGYRAHVLISIHTDSCTVPEATGFKVARVSASHVPEIEDRLVAYLIESYQESTRLPVHETSITYDMTEYHAFYEIAPETPAAIIEIGFMAADRQLLTRRPDLVAKGIADGLQRFIEDTY